MTSRSGRGRWERVLAARHQARSALGKDLDHTELFDAAPQKKSTPYVPLAQPPIEPPRNESVYVVTLAEAAHRLGVSRAELEAMIAAGKVKALPTGFTRTIPTSEVRRLRQPVRQAD